MVPGRYKRDDNITPVRRMVYKGNQIKANSIKYTNVDFPEVNRLMSFCFVFVFILFCVYVKGLRYGGL